MTCGRWCASPSQGPTAQTEETCASDRTLRCRKREVGGADLGKRDAVALSLTVDPCSAVLERRRVPQAASRQPVECLQGLSCFSCLGWWQAAAGMHNEEVPDGGP